MLKIEHRGCGDILTNPPRELASWLWDGYIRENIVAMLAGHSESGKGLFSLQLAVCVVAAKSFLGRKVKNGKVLYLSAEDDEEELQARVYQIVKGLGLEQGLLGNLELRSTIDMQCAPALLNDKMQPEPLLIALIDYCRENKPALIVIDTFAAFGPHSDTTKSSIVTKFLTTLAALLPNTTILFTLHLRKPSNLDGGRRPSQHDIRDSSAIVASARASLIIHDNCITLPNCNGRHRTATPVLAEDELRLEMKQGWWTIDNQEKAVKTGNASKQQIEKGGKKCNQLPKNI